MKTRLILAFAAIVALCAAVLYLVLIHPASYATSPRLRASPPSSSDPGKGITRRAPAVPIPRHAPLGAEGRFAKLSGMRQPRTDAAALAAAIAPRAEPDSPPRPSASISTALQEILNSTPPAEMAKRAQELLASSNATVRAIGTILLLESGRTFTPDMMDALTGDTVFPPLLVLGWLGDGNRPNEAAALVAAWLKSGLDLDAMDAVLVSGRIEDSPGRAALDVVVSSLDDTARAKFLCDVAANSGLESGTRLRSLLLAETAMDAAEYRATLKSYASEAKQVARGEVASKLALPGDAAASYASGRPSEERAATRLWEATIHRAANRVLEPEIAALRVPVLQRDDVEVLFGSPIPTTLETAALLAERVLETPGGLVEPGTTQCLTDCLRAYPNPDLPTEGQSAALRRIKTRLSQLEARERPFPTPAAR